MDNLSIPLIFGILFSHVFIVADATISGGYSCFYDPLVKGYKFNVTLRPDKGHKIEKLSGYTKNDVTGTLVLCSLPFTTPVIVVVRRKESLPCGVTYEKNGTRHIYVLRLTTVTQGGILTTNDRIFTTAECATCVAHLYAFGTGGDDGQWLTVCPDSIPCTPMIMNVTARVTVIEREVDSGIPKQFLEDLSLLLIDASTGKAITTTTLGDRVFLRLLLRLQSLPGSATGVKVIQLSSTDGSVDSSTMKYMKDDGSGCSIDSDLVIGIFGFNHTLLERPGYYAVDSPVFPAYIHASGELQIIYKGDVVFCYNNANAECNQGCKDKTGRRRRTANSRRADQSAAMIVKVYRRGDKRTHNLNRGSSGHNTASVQHIYLMTPWVALAMLLFLIILSQAVIILGYISRV